MSHDNHHDDDHPKYLAHHFDSMTQQYESGKLGMWVFLATELLMFGGLFVAYTIYRSNNPDVYMYAHQALDTRMGAINTVILLLSSFTMAWGVRAAQLGKQYLLVVLLALTFLGGCGFMVVKTFEYSGKYANGLWVGPANAFFYDSALVHEETGGLEEGINYIAHHAAPSENSHEASAHSPVAEHHESDEHAEPGHAEVVAAIDDGVSRSTIALAAIGPIGTTATAISDPTELGHASHSYPTFDELSPGNKKRTHIFFQIYYCMTGLHVLHVLIGMAVLLWLVHVAGNSLVKAFVPPAVPLLFGLYLLFLWWKIDLGWATLPGVQVAWTLGVGLSAVALAAVWAALRVVKARSRAVEPGRFGANYFTPVDIGGLYWHLVDLIWIFLFPLLYLIH